MNRQRLLRQWRDQLSAWLPVMMMALLALGTWWLVRSAPKPPSAETERPARHEPDYFMRDFSVRRFDPQGRMTTELRGPSGNHFPDTDTLEVKDPRMRSFDEQGQLTVGSADRGVSNADGSEVQLYGNARVVREAVTRSGGGVVPRAEFRGEYLHVFVDEDRVSSDKPVELIRGNDRFTGDRFEYDNKTGVARLDGRVRGLLIP